MPGAAGRRRPPETCPDARQVLAPADVIRLESDAVVMLDQTRLPGERVGPALHDRLRALPRRSGSWRSAARRRSGARLLWAWRRRPARAARAELAVLRADPGDARRAARRARVPRRSISPGPWRAATRRSRRRPPSGARRARRWPRRIHADEVAPAAPWARHGAELFPPGARVLTHCNAGALRRGGYGRRSASCARRTRATRRARLGRRDAPAPAGRPPDRLGAGAGRHPRTLIAERRPLSVRPRAGRRRRRRRRPDRAQRRRREQDRHLQPGGAGPRPRRPVLRRRALLDDRPAIAGGADIPIEERARTSSRASATGPRAGATSRSPIPPSTSRPLPTSRRS